MLVVVVVAVETDADGFIVVVVVVPFVFAAYEPSIFFIIKFADGEPEPAAAAVD